MPEATLEQRMTVLEETVVNCKRRSTLVSRPPIGWTA